jgi:K+-transporting ATPase KdpF subunit
MAGSPLSAEGLLRDKRVDFATCTLCEEASCSSQGAAAPWRARSPEVGRFGRGTPDATPALMALEYGIGLFVSVALLAYLAYALVKPERF